MSDVRALLKAKRQEAKITHPYATYNAAGQLRCSVCGVAVKHAAAWEGHLGSKGHRTGVARMKEEEKARAMREEEERAREVAGEEEEEEEEEDAPAGTKRKASTPPAAPADKKRKVEEGGFPADFFSDPSRAPVLLSDDDDEGEGGGEGESGGKGEGQAEPRAADTAVESEYERFQRELQAMNTDPTETYARATVAAEAVPATSAIEGFPEAEEAAVEPIVEATEAEVRVRREQEERELIMDRLLEEERAQEEADTRVQLLKSKLDALRRKRTAKKGSSTSTLPK